MQTNHYCRKAKFNICIFIFKIINAFYMQIKYKCHEAKYTNIYY